MSDLHTPFVNDKRTVCEVLRTINGMLLKSSIPADAANAIIGELEEAYRMAKKMDAKLRQYKHNYDDGWWEKNRIITDTLERKKEGVLNEHSEKDCVLR